MRLSADTFYYGIGKMGEGVAALVLIPVLTRAFSPTEFGLWDIVVTFFVITTTVTSLALEVSLSAFYFETEDAVQRKTIASTSVYFRFFSSFLVAIVIFLLAPAISSLIFDAPHYSRYFRIVAAAIPFFLGMNIFRQLLRVSFAPGKYNVVSIGYAALYALFGIFLVVRMQMGINGILLGMLAALVVASLVGAVFTRRFLAFQFSMSALRKMLSFGLPILPSLFACWIIDFSDRYFLARLSTLEQVGIYSAGAKISSIIILFVTSFQMAWLPYALSIQHKEDARERYSRGLFLFLLICLIGGTGIVIFVKPILILLTQPKYYGAEKVVGLLVLATIAYGAYLIMNIGLIIAKKTSFTSISVGVGALLNIALNFMLIPHYGMLGAAAATLISYLVAAAAIYWFANRWYPIDYRFSRIFKLVFLSICIMLIASIIGFESSMFWDVIFSVILFIIFLFYIRRFFLSSIK